MAAKRSEIYSESKLQYFREMNENSSTTSKRCTLITGQMKVQYEYNPPPDPSLPVILKIVDDVADRRVRAVLKQPKLRSLTRPREVSLQRGGAGVKHTVACGQAIFGKNSKKWRMTI